MESDVMNAEKYIKDLAAFCKDMFRATGSMFQQEHSHFISMVTAAGGPGASGGCFKYTKGIMEHRAIQNLKAVNGDMWFFRQRHQKFTIALGQFKEPCEEMVHRFAREITLGKQFDVVTCTLHAVYGEVLDEAFGDFGRFSSTRPRQRGTRKSR